MKSLSSAVVLVMTVLAVTLFPQPITALESALQPTTVVTCDIAVLGGTAASLGAAITAAEANASLTVCLTEITDWPGGQLSASGVSAIDFGPWNNVSANLPRSFNSLWQYTNMTEGVDSGCWVSYDCYLPPSLVNGWVFPTLNGFPNLKLMLRTVPVRTSRAGDRIVSVTLITRAPVHPDEEWALPLSQTLPDWYSPVNSSRFTKAVVELRATVFIDATEFADVLVTSGAPFTQGAEYPHETSMTSDASCGLSATLVFFMALRDAATNASITVPLGNDAGTPFPYEEWSSQYQWNQSWTYRRGVCSNNNGSLCNGNDPQSWNTVNTGDVTQQNWVNDVDNGYFFDPLTWSASKDSAWWAAHGWTGSVNLTTQKLLEDRAYGTFHFMLNTTSMFRDRLDMSYASTGTPTGLSKMPYLRDARRAVGLGGFRFTYDAEDFYNASYPYVGEQFYDTIGLGDYLYADMHKLSFCELPAYQWRNETKPYFIPFRALTVMNVTNLLVAGKTMAQTFHANAATRLHPVEWSSGVGAGAAAALMVEAGYATTQDVLDHIGQLQAKLTALGQPLTWTPPGPLPLLQIGYGCVQEFGGRCVGVTASAFLPPPLFPSNTCNSTCGPLASIEWLIGTGDWAPVNASAPLMRGTWMQAHFPTVVTKSLAQAITLAPSEKRSVNGGKLCQLISPTVFDDHHVCLFSKM